MKNILILVIILVAATFSFAKVDISQDILRDQYAVEGNIIDTGVKVGRKTVLIDASVNRVLVKKERPSLRQLWEEARSR